MGEDKGTGKAILAGAVAGGTAIGIVELIKALTTPGAPKPGVQVVAPDEDTKKVFAAVLSLLAAISSKLDKLDSIDDHLSAIEEGILALAGIELEYRFRITPTETNLVIAGNVTKDIYATTTPEKGAIARIKLVSTGKDIEYNLYIDNQRWIFNVSDMVDQLIKYPHFPGAWIEKASGGEYVFIFSGGDSMQVRFWNNFRLVARTTTTSTSVTILEGEIVEKIFP
jgi:hypothetical protein